MALDPTQAIVKCGHIVHGNEIFANNSAIKIVWLSLYQICHTDFHPKDETACILKVSSEAEEMS